MIYIEEHTRALTPDELSLEREAMLWLLKKGVGIEQIRLLSIRTIDREEKRVSFTYQVKAFMIQRNIPFKGSPLEAWLPIAQRSCLSGYFVFPKRAWKGRCPNFCPIYTLKEAKEFLEVGKPRKDAKKVLIFSVKNCKIEINR